jgi:hypothetical protein
MRISKYQIHVRRIQRSLE